MTPMMSTPMPGGVDPFDRSVHDARTYNAQRDQLRQDAHQVDGHWLSGPRGERLDARIAATWQAEAGELVADLGTALRILLAVNPDAARALASLAMESVTRAMTVTDEPGDAADALDAAGRRPVHVVAAEVADRAATVPLPEPLETMVRLLDEPGE